MESLCGCKIPDGHPLFVLYKENNAISKKLAALRDKLLFDEPDGFDGAMDDVRCTRSHYETDVCSSDLTVDTGLASEMPAEDSRILEELAFLDGNNSLSDAAWDERLLAVLGAMRDMLSKENNVLYPHLSQTLTEEQWIQVYFAFRTIAPCHIGAYPIWVRAENPDAPRCTCEQ